MRMKIKKLKQELRNIIDPDFALLLNLQRSCNLTDEKRYEILSRTTVHQKADELLRWLVEDVTGNYDDVMVAFEEAGQKHVVNFIVADGGISSLFQLMSD